jgi:hypothetical protein
VLDVDHGKDEVGGRPLGFDRGQCVVAQLRLLFEDELNLLTGLLLERSDDLPDRLVLLLVLPLLPPHHEVGGLRAEWRYDQRCGEN